MISGWRGRSSRDGRSSPNGSVVESARHPLVPARSPSRPPARVATVGVSRLRSAALARCRALLRGGRRLLQLDSTERRDLLDAQYQLLRARLELVTTPSGRMLHLQPASSPPAGVDAHGIEKARQLATAVERAAENGPLRPSCLIRSIALQRLLVARGLPGGRIRVGVAGGSGSTGPFQAHAWVEYGGRPLGDRAIVVDRFTAFDESAAAVDR
jgi:hypothetical protein